MPKKKAFDAKGLIKMVEAGETSGDIMKKMGFKTSVQLKTAYMSALIEAGRLQLLRAVVAVVKLRRQRRSGLVSVVPLSFRRI